MTELIFTFQNFANAPNKVSRLIHLYNSKELTDERKTKRQMDKNYKASEHWIVHFGDETADLRATATAVSDSTFRMPENNG